ncbi:hypothetical protein K4F52_010271 [Lecanicillium sp. MT-2017a]|nr:hypothetical protein K4F52_010271 [Lecanicillium sp. MT-2017a]
MRSTIRARGVGCPLCVYYEWGPIVNTHKLKYCQHREEADQARQWLDMFRGYTAQGGGRVSSCPHCRFPAAVCWRIVYREEMDSGYGSEVEAREKYGVWYHEVRCAWVKTIQRYVAGVMVAGGIVDGFGVGKRGIAALRQMGWEDWACLEAQGPESLRAWLEQPDEVDDLPCPRLLRLFWLQAHSATLSKRPLL